MNPSDVTIAIPTYHRGPVLLATVEALLRQPLPAGEVLVIDQTPEHEPAVAHRLAGWDAAGVIRWLRRSRPSVPAAMNHGLLTARRPLVLFLDDDIVPAGGLVAAHAANYADPGVWAVTGQVLQPGQTPCAFLRTQSRPGLWHDLDFRFNGTERCEVRNCMAGNLSVRREQALRVGGFDENFVAVAYRFETEFCRRLVRGGGKVRFDPAASIRHLQAPSGGTRSYGHGLRTGRPEHSVGDYYFALREGTSLEAARFAAARFCRAVRSRYYLTHPWWAPLKVVAELRGLWWALRLARRGPSYLRASS